MASDTFTSSFGVELEFVIAVKLRPSGPPPGFETSSGRAIDGREERDAISEYGLEVEVLETYLSDTIHYALEGFEGDYVITSEDQLDGDGEHLEPYTAWTVKRDFSVTVPNNDGFGPYYWQDVEITSPALFATEKSFEEVRRVVNAIKSQWWVFAPETAAVHVHYGRGLDWIPFEHIRKIAAFLYAADPVLAQMHTKNQRDDSMYCPSNQLYSDVAHGMTSTIAKMINSSNYGHHGEYCVESPAIHLGDYLSQQLQSEVNERLERPPTMFSRGRLPGYEYDEDFFDDTHNAFALGLDSNLDWNVDVRRGVKQILACENAPSIASMHFNTIRGRSAYNFTSYSSRWREGFSGKRTIEFRQAQGTLDPDEVIAHCKISIGLADFASRADISELVKMLENCARAEEDPMSYDVIDLLFDLDLVEETLVILRRHMRDRGIEITEELLNTYRNFARLSHRRNR